MGVSDQELGTLVRRSADLPPPRGEYRQTDFITNLFLSVLDYSSSAEAVLKALAHYRENLWDQIRTMEDLKRFLARYPDDPQGNLEAGAHLWGFRAARRVSELRGLIRYFKRKGVTTQEDLVRWAKTSSYRDFMGQVRGLSLQVYEAILTRQGFGSIKPAPHITRFVSATIGRAVSEEEAVEAVARAALELDMPVRDLERRIYEQNRH
ncbi:MAG: hypothetical protein M3164_00235 [Actinomycetota bacterium]|nr:hypothetical protein [Actinomycetota bacterium]